MERKEEIWRLFSLVTFPSEGKETRLDLRRWPTFASKENSSEWTNSRKGIDLFISSRWIEFLIATAMFLSLSLSLLPLQHLKWSKHSLNGLPVAFARKWRFNFNETAARANLPSSLRAIILFKSFPLLLPRVSLPFLPLPPSSPPPCVNFTEQEISSRKRQCRVAVSRVARRIPNFCRDSW